MADPGTMTDMKPQDAYNALIEHTRQAALLGSCVELLGWDEETYMPPGGAQQRGRQLAMLAGLYHERVAAPEVGDWLEELDGSPLLADAGEPAAVNVREIRRAHLRACQLPRRLVEELAQTTALAQQAWATARRRSEWQVFLPWLEKIIHLKRQEAESHQATGGRYDALLEDYEPGARTADLTRIFAELREGLGPLLDRIRGASRQPDVSVLNRRYPFQRQRTFAERVASALGFDFKRGRLDSTTHPFFAVIGPGDVRITTRYALNHFCDAFFATLHEVGHGLYEQGLPPEHHGTPMGEATSVGLHESQARLWENAVGKSLGFWEHFFASAQAAFPAALGDVTLDQFHFAIHQVGQSLNRVRADEVTYNLHIAVRFELEQALIGGDLAAADLPGAWKEIYRRDLGVEIPNDAEGCLQDGHWSAGMFGYFPTYTLGNIMAAQLTELAGKELGGLDEQFARGDFATLLEWLRSGIYQHGSRFAARELIAMRTGKAPSPGALIAYLRTRYGQAYGVT
jgi:carboxypeptidase Taq